ncbi:MAG: hypothetical protein M5R42_06530 [Rhodocyclaceae bacterium]|nr:hypothetical protein [Rhodocyclaceae bacterium]
MPARTMRSNSSTKASASMARCQNCALCTAACPTAALGADNLPRLDLLRRAIKTTRFSFACAPSGLATRRRGALPGALDATMLAYLAKRRIAVELHGSHHCAQMHPAPGARRGSR